ncbi:hypothetical protein OG898_27095 [Streptomyces sp. NBC_00193]|uniref:hypothetical protein n=1 Tax=Streptomyces sp. NBC_00193 TaxID=2975675 RepID=UPI00225B6CAC|nr:hypothetical protein [Streptomyces sp. NBC_00193]MCX5300115.1 hypothetical protein [Streptomyces sp. NBC_00193]
MAENAGSGGGDGSGGDGSGSSGSGTGGEGAGGAGPLTCPRCGREDQVLGVSAAYLRSKAKMRVERGGGEDEIVTTREENSELAKALAVAPDEPDSGTAGCIGVLLFLASVGAFVWSAIEGKWFEDGSTFPRLYGTDDAPFTVDQPSTYLVWIGAALLLVGIVLLALSGRAVRTWRRRTEPGRVAADRVWADGWYCGRCGTVHFAGERALSLQEFRTRVWSAGGYGDLAVRHPAV